MHPTPFSRSAGSHLSLKESLNECGQRMDSIYIPDGSLGASLDASLDNVKEMVYATDGRDLGNKDDAVYATEGRFE